MSTTTLKKTRNRWHRLSADEMDEVLAKEIGSATSTALFGPNLGFRLSPYIHRQIMTAFASSYIGLVSPSAKDEEKIKAAKDVLANASDHFRHADGGKAVHLAKIYLEAFLTGRH
jgi:hypothetical protein